MHRTGLTWVVLGATLLYMGLMGWAVAAWNGPLRPLFAQETSSTDCGCTPAVSFTEYPLIFGGLVVLSLSMLSLGVVFVFQFVRIARNSRRQVSKLFLASPPPHIQDIWHDLIQQAKARFVPLVLFHEHSPRAFCAGVAFPRVYCSSGAAASLPPAELRAVLAHELMHAQMYDPLLTLILQAWLHCFPRGLRTSFQHRLTTYLECRADAAATTLVRPQLLGQALLHALEWPQHAVLHGMVSMQTAVEYRLHVLAGWRQAPSIQPARYGMLGLFVVVVFSLSLLSAQRAVAQETKNGICHEVMSVVITLETGELVRICPSQVEWSPSH